MHATTYASPAHRNLAILLGQRQRISAALQEVNRRDSQRPAPLCPGLTRLYAHSLAEILDAIEAIPGWSRLAADLAEV
jgi:hypothetical protein